MAHHDHRAARNHHLQNSFQVPAQLLDGVGLDGRRSGLSVAALVVEHHPDLITPPLGKGCALKVEGAHPQAETMGEHDCQWRGDRPDFPNHQGNTVRCGDHAAAIGVEQMKVFALVGIPDGLALTQCLGSRHSGRGAQRPEAGGAGHQPGLPADTTPVGIGFREGFRLPVRLTGHRSHPRCNCAAPDRAGW